VVGCSINNKTHYFKNFLII